MGALCDQDLSDLVRKVLPRPSPIKEWRVDLVDKVEEAGSCQQDATVRIHRSWRDSIYKAGFQFVTRHYPLALEPIAKNENMMLWRDRGFRLWRGMTIEHEYSHGKFTGNLTQGPAFIAQTVDGLGLYADEDCACAARMALSARRKKVWQENTNKYALTKLRNELRELLSNRFATNRGYPGSHCVSLTPYRGLVPSEIVNALLLYGEATVPLIELENASVDVVLTMPSKDISALLYQLDSDISAARTLSFDTPAGGGDGQLNVEKSCGLTLDEDLWLMNLSGNTPEL